MSWKTALIVGVVVLVGVTAWGAYAYTQCVGPFAGMGPQHCPMVTSAPANVSCPHYSECPGPMTNCPCGQMMREHCGRAPAQHMGCR